MAHLGDHGHDEEQRFDTAAFLAHAGLGRKIVRLDPNGSLFSQGDSADSVFLSPGGASKADRRFAER